MSRESDRDAWRDLAVRALAVLDRLLDERQRDVPRLPLEDLVDLAIRRALDDARGSQREAAALLGVSPRMISYYLRKRAKQAVLEEAS